MEIGKLRFGAEETIAALVFVVASVMTWASAASFAENPEYTPVSFFVWLLLATVAYGITALIVTVNPWAIRILFFVGFLLAVPVAFRGSAYLGIPVALLAGLLAEAGIWRAKRFRNVLRTPITGLTARRALPMYFSAISVVLTAILFLSPIGTRAIANPVPEPFIRQSIRLADPLIRVLVGYSVEGTVDEIIARAIAERLPEGEEVDPRLIVAQREQYAERYDVEISGDDSVSSVVERMISKQLVKLEDQIEQYYKIGFFVAAFFLFQLLSLPFTWITTSLLLAVMGLLRLLNIVHIKTEQKPIRVMRWASDAEKSTRGGKSGDEPAAETAQANAG